MSLAFTVPGPPVPKQRARVFWDKRIGKYRAVTPPRTAQYQARVAARFKVAYPHHRPISGRVGIVLRFYTRDARGDSDNFQKATVDALNRRAWIDDRQIDHADVSVVRNSPTPRTEIEIYELDAEHAGLAS